MQLLVVYAPQATVAVKKMCATSLAAVPVLPQTQESLERSAALVFALNPTPSEELAHYQERLASR